MKLETINRPVFVCLRCGQKYNLSTERPPRICLCGGLIFIREND